MGKTFLLGLWWRVAKSYTVSVSQLLSSLTHVQNPRVSFNRNGTTVDAGTSRAGPSKHGGDGSWMDGIATASAFSESPKPGEGSDTGVSSSELFSKKEGQKGAFSPFRTALRSWIPVSLHSGGAAKDIAGGAGQEGHSREAGAGVVSHDVSECSRENSASQMQSVAPSAVWLQGSRKIRPYQPIKYDHRSGAAALSSRCRKTRF